MLPWGRNRQQTQHPTVSNVTAGEQSSPNRQLEKLKTKKPIILIFSPHKTRDNPVLSLQNHHVTEITACVLHCTGAFTHKHFCRQMLIQTAVSTHRCFYKRLLHTDAFTHRRFYTQTLLHTDALTHRRFDTHAHTHTPTHTQKDRHTHTHTHKIARNP